MPTSEPETFVSDNGAVFTAAAYEGLLEDLGITVTHIEKGKPWENLIEAQFKVQLRLAEGGASSLRAPSAAERFRGTAIGAHRRSALRLPRLKAHLAREWTVWLLARNAKRLRPIILLHGDPFRDRRTRIMR